MNDPYAALVRYYDAETADYTDDLTAYVTLARRFGDPVLDVGCGTGRVAFALAKQGFQVVGVDSSEPMLTRARARSLREGVGTQPIVWSLADITTLTLQERFGLAVCAYNGFMHLVDPGQQSDALKRIAAHLNPGGALAIDIANPIEMFHAEDTAGLVLERTFDDPETGEMVMQQSVAVLDRAAQVMSLTWIYDRIAENGIVHRDIVPLRLRYTMASEMRLLLHQAGFHNTDICGDYDFRPYQEDSPRLLVIAERAG